MSHCLVFGQSGQVAQSIAQLRNQYTALDIIQLGRDDADLCHPETIAAQILKHQPTIVINAAAYTKVDQAETDEATATLVNATSPTRMAEACKQVNAALIHISTDYVFAGDSSAPYTEDDPFAPTGAYGRSKALGEHGIKDALDRHIILRTAWVFSDTGQNFVKTMLRLNREVVRVVDDQTGGPTPAKAIATTILDMATRIARGGPALWGTYHFSGQPATTWFGFAQAIFDEARKLGQPTPKLEPINTDQYPTPARRPAWSVLNHEKIQRDWGITPPDWRHALPDIVNSLIKQG